MLNCLLILTLYKILSVRILSNSLYPAEAVIKTDIHLIIHTCPDLQAVAGGHLSHAVGLPITLAQLDIKEDVPAKMRIVAEAACAEGETIHNMPGGATPDQVYAALLVADQYGQRFLQEWE